MRREIENSAVVIRVKHTAKAWDGSGSGLGLVRSVVLVRYATASRHHLGID